MAFINNCSLVIFKDSTITYNIVDPYYKKFESFSITLGEDAKFVSIFADPKASLNSGKLYVASSNGFFVIDLANKILYDNYTLSIKGRANELLTQESIVDITVGV